MTLHEAINIVLLDASTPLTINEITDEINFRDLYYKKDNSKISSAQIRSRLLKYKTDFTDLNGYYITADNIKWRNLLSSYWDLIYFTQNEIIPNEREILILSLFYYKRLYDLSQYSNISFDKKDKLKFAMESIHSPNDLIWMLNKCDKYIGVSSFMLRELEEVSNTLSIEKFSRLIEYFQNISTREFSISEYGIAFEFFTEINRKEFSALPIIRTPREVIDVMLNILSPTSGALYDPVCGTGGFITQAYRENNDLKIFGSEINPRIAKFAKMNLIMNGDYSDNIKIEDCFDQLDNNIKYDYIIGDLPLTGFKYKRVQELNYKWNLDIRPNTKAFSPFLLFSIEKLKQNGKAVFAISDSFLYKTGIEQKIRNLLLHEDLIETIISLPDGILKPYTSGKVSIIILNKSKPLILKNHIRFIQTKEFSDINQIEIEKINEIYQDTSLQNYNAQIVSSEEIINFKSFNPKHYTQEFFELRKLISSGKGKYLSELFSIETGKQIKDKGELVPGSGIPYVKIENLNRDILDVYLSIENVKDYISYDSYNVKGNIISKECLLIAKIGDHLKPTYFKPSNHFREIIIHPNVIALFPKIKSEVSLEYLYYQLYSDFIQNQIELNSKRSVVPFRTIQNIKDLIVQFPDSNAQREFIEIQKANSIAAERARINDRLSKLGYKEEAEERELNIVRTISHQLKHRLASLSLRLEKISDIVKKNDIGGFKLFDDNDPILIPEEGVHPPENETLNKAIEKIVGETEFLSCLLSDVEKAITLSLKFEKIDILQEFRTLSKNYNNENFSIELKGDKALVELSPTHIKELFDTLIKNAIQHGFKDSPRNNMISFRIRNDLERGIVIIEYSNNGKPFKIPQEDYISILTKSKASNGSGIGGFYINKIIEAHGGLLHIDKDFSKGMKMVIELPINQKDNE